MFCSCLPRGICVATIELFAVFVAVGCSGDDTRKRDSYADDVIAVASSKELFPGDLSRLEPHLDLMASGCVALMVRHRAWTQKLSLQVWTKGKATKPKFIGETSIDIDEISISMKEVGEHQSRVKVTIVERGPKGSVAFHIELEKPALKTGEDSPKTWGGSPKNLLRETPIKKDETTTIWGYIWGEVGGRIDLNETFEETAKRKEWAILLRVTPQENE